MRSGIVVFFAVFLSVYGLVNLYIGRHGWRFFKHLSLAGHPALYWTIFWLLALAYLLSRIMNHHLPGAVYETFHFIGAYWLAAMFYLFLIFLAVDLVRLAARFLPFLSGALAGHPKLVPAAGAAILLLVLGLLAWGSVNARVPIVTRYELDVPKRAGSLAELEIAAVSDIHLGTIVDRTRLASLVDRLNALEPDIVLFAGDVLDEDLGPFIEQGMAEEFRRLRTKYGVFAVPGNHEYIGGHIEEFSTLLAEAGVEILIDRTAEVAGSFYVAGRDDLSAERFTGRKRKSLAEIFAGTDRDLPVLLLDHQPYNLAEAEAAGADLQISGHTHRGQLFPNNLVTRALYEIDYGFKKKGATNVVVSSGYGTWGPPVRIGSRSEILSLRLRFKP